MIIRYLDKGFQKDLCAAFKDRENWIVTEYEYTNEILEFLEFWDDMIKKYSCKYDAIKQILECIYAAMAEQSNIYHYDENIIEAYNYLANLVGMQTAKFRSASEGWN